MRAEATAEVTGPRAGSVCVAFAADNMMSKGLAAAVRSVADRLADTGRHGAIFVIDCGVSERTRRRVSGSVRGTTSAVRWLGVDAAAAGMLRRLSLHSTRPYPPAAYARLLLPALLPAVVDRVVYLDADVIVRHDLGTLWDEPMGDDVLFAVRDLPLDNGNAARIARTVDQRRVPYPADSVYFQSGVLVMDIARMRTEAIAEQAFALLEEHPGMQFPDQDALNALLVARTRLIDARWNQMSAVYGYAPGDPHPAPFDAATLRVLQDDPHIVHYSGRPKPWEPGCRHPLADDWFASLDRTPWRGWRPTRLNAALARVPQVSRTLRTRLLRRLNDRRAPAPPAAQGRAKSPVTWPP